MNRHHILLLIVIVLVTGAIALPLLAQRNSAAILPTVDCKKCHTCNQPSLRDPCLVSCPRTETAHQTGTHVLRDAPDSMLLSQLADLYQPVHFNHKVHASMAQMGTDCATCHHFSPAGEIPPCRDCHSSSSESTDLKKPNLKGAYHRQCLSCHREWSHDTKCVLCHIPNAEGAMKAATEDPTDIIGKPHPIITEPIKKIYETPYPSAPIVTFQHKQHIDLFGFRCVDCHEKENCGNCHDLQQLTKVKKTQEQVHAVCNDCHKTDACTKCHDTKERPGFSHQKTGWPLNRFHQKLDCWACHPTGKKIARLSPTCANCHAGWNQDNFKHAVTGLRLDEVHSELDCTDCHAENKYDAAPKCDDCHDDGRTAKTMPPGVKAKSAGK